ncbi:MAG TPA: cupin domain-containing protein [Gaiellaceae bacterium]|nr:cupin domain-containing protein [Gaiellaceae bacterium]
MKSFNLSDGELDEQRTEPAGFTWRSATLGPKLGAEKIGMSVYELQLGERSFPYHYEYGAEEWLIVVSGRPTLRAPDGEHELRPGDVVCFPEGPAGAHLVRNDTGEPLRVLLGSTKGNPQLAVYPDSGKIGMWPGNDADPPQLFARDSAVGYWEGEV